MSPKLRNSLAGIGLTCLVSFLGALAGAGSTAILPAAILGLGLWYYLSNTSNNRTAQVLPAPARDAALQAMPPADHALIYIYREGFSGKTVGFDVVLDEKTVAQLKSPVFTQLLVPAGTHEVSIGPKGFMASQNKSIPTSFVANAGETIVFATEVKRGMAQNLVTLKREPDLQPALRKLSTMNMVATESNI